MCGLYQKTTTGQKDTPHPDGCGVGGECYGQTSDVDELLESFDTADLHFVQAIGTMSRPVIAG